MIENADLIDTLLRGGAAGVSLLLALILATVGRRSRTGLLGALFSFSTAIYVVISSAVLPLPQGAAAIPLVIIAIWGTVFFWWFGSSLFDDSFRWRWWRFAPLVLLPSFFLTRFFGVVEGNVAAAFLYFHLTINALLFADVLRLAIVHAGDDLVDPRRRFRIVISVVVGVFGIGIAIVELAETQIPLPDALRHLQAASIFALNVLFGAWFLAPRDGLFALDDAPAPADSSPQSPRISAADRAIFDKLTGLMSNGAYRAEALTVASLAEQVGVPEHHLRKLINGALGFRNFSAFLNSYRIKDAKKALADPENARRQIIQIALDLGYGSIAPFNRAFKEATGKTPTAYRKDALDQA